jgi:eukaryotic-like serine/threonine-protein kinase
MPELPPQELVATLERLGLATAEQVLRMRRRVGRLAKDLPRFDSVWIDALAQARMLTPFQAAELNAGRGGTLRVGPFLLCERLAHPCYVASYRANNVDSGEMVRLAVVEIIGPRADAILGQLRLLVKSGNRSSGGSGAAPPHGSSTDAPTEEELRSHAIHRRVDAAAKRAEATPSPDLPLSPAPSLITCSGRDGDRVFAASPWINGRAAAEWIVHHGRFPPEVVLEIARAMLVELAALEKIGVSHGDVSTSSLILTDGGEIALALPGLRAVLRPEEGYAHADLLPEAFDSLAPERIASGGPPGTAGDVYACGCVWWHLLCGRPPLAGGNSLTKLRAAQAGGICDVRRNAPDAPPALAAAIAACVEVEPGRRPESMARLAAMLGSPTQNGKGALADCLSRTGRPMVHWTTTARSIRRSSRTPLWLAGAVCCLAATVAVFWPGAHRAGLSGSSPSSACENASSKCKTASGQCEAASGSRARQRNDNAPTRVEEGAVVRATFQQPLAPPADLVLAADRPLTDALVELREGQRVRAASGHRATLLAPEAGLIVDKENVRFENIDFVWKPARSTEPVRSQGPAIVRLLAGRVEFRGCSFRCKGREQGAPSSFSGVPAIRWMHPAQIDPSETSLPSGRIRLADCVFYHVGAGVDCCTVGALGIELTNTLHLGAGPLLRLDHCPRSDEPLSLNLSQVTLRGSGPLLECLAPHAEEQPVEITVRATACVFAPQTGEPLVCCGAILPERLLGGLRWSGQGSLVTTQTPILNWKDTSGVRTVDESALSIAGLVRSEVEFAGGLSSDPAASRIIRWQAPLQSADPPGIDPAPLPWSRREIEFDN